MTAVQVDIPKGYSSKKFLFQKVFIPEGHYSEKFYPEGRYSKDF